MRALFVAGLLLAAMPSAQAQIPQVNLPANGPVVGIAVTEMVQTRPDLALFDVGVTSTASTATAAVTENARKMQNIIGRIRAAGIAERDIQTTGISLYPQHSNPPPLPNGSYGQPRIVGYTASNGVRIRHRRLEEVGGIIDALVAAGANNINGPTFTIEQPEVRAKEARERALATAQVRANEYAAKAGARSIRLLSITEGAQGRSYGNDIVVTASRMSTMDVAAPPPPPSPVQPGEIVTSVSMFVQYALER
jgi:uncharacterized protein